MRRLWKAINSIMNDFSIQKKLLITYVFCMLIPMFLTDGVILYVVMQGENARLQYQAQNIASSVESYFINTVEEAVDITNNVYINRQINETLEYNYKGSLDFFERTYGFTANNFWNMTVDGDSTKVMLYADNDTITNGKVFYRIDKIQDTVPYQKLQESSNNIAIAFYHTDTGINIESQRKISILRKLDYYKDLQSEKFVQVELNYGHVVRRFNEMKYGAPVYVCSGDTILFSNRGYSDSKPDFQKLSGKEKVELETQFHILGEDFRILVMETEDSATQAFERHFPLIAVMITVNVLLPFVMIGFINRSFVVRLKELSKALETADGEAFAELPDAQGKDEIGVLIRNYNRMAKRIQGLIRTVFKDRLEKQEVDLARQRAELLALHSQINPHFLFNVLESIRMHSVLKNEDETARMVERLAILERQNVDWSADNIPVREELRFIEAYLELQKYRFGQRLSYQVTVEEGCGNYLIPRLTLVTFVENACVHGVEKKAVPCWIYVRIYEEKNMLCLEVEDTGSGMEEEEVRRLTEQMENANIEALHKKEHIGVINACLRLKMSTQDQVVFELESEKDVGTFMVIKIPVQSLKKIRLENGGEDNDASVAGR